MQYESVVYPIPCNDVCKRCDDNDSNGVAENNGCVPDDSLFDIKPSAIIPILNNVWPRDMTYYECECDNVILMSA